MTSTAQSDSVQPNRILLLQEQLVEEYNMMPHDVGNDDTFPLLLSTLRDKKVRGHISNLECIHLRSNSLNHFYPHRLSTS